MQQHNNEEQAQWSQQAGTAYDSLSNTTRKALIKLVMEQNLSVRKASKILKIKYTTAKALVQKYRLTGNIDRQRARRMTFEDDQREKYRKDLIKKLPFQLEEDSEDEKWGFAAQSTVNMFQPKQVSQVTAPPIQRPLQQPIQVTPSLFTQWPFVLQYLNNSYSTLFNQSQMMTSLLQKPAGPEDQAHFDFQFYTTKINNDYEKRVPSTQPNRLQTEKEEKE